MRVRAGLVSQIFKKALLLSNDERAGRTTGDIVNLQSTDATRLQDLCTYGQVAYVFLPSSPPRSPSLFSSSIVLTIVSLRRQLVRNLPNHSRVHLALSTTRLDDAGRCGGDDPLDATHCGDCEVSNEAPATTDEE